jgi:hypothetical protein
VEVYLRALLPSALYAGEWRALLREKSHRYQLDTRLDGPHSQPEPYEEVKINRLS